jgi:DinB family protein
MNFYLDRARGELDEALRGIELQELQRKLDGKWCPAEILEHLSLTFEGTARSMERCLQAQGPRPGSGSWRERVAKFVVVNLSHMPAGQESPAMVRPRGAPAEAVVTAIYANLDRMGEAIRDCVQRFGAKVQLARHPVLGPLNATEWSKFHFVHTRHHMKQVARIRREAPASRQS